MAKILVSGLTNIEITLRVESFPIVYTPERYPFFNVNTGVSGVGYNIARALTILGDEVRFLSIIGKDALSGLVRAALQRDQIPEKNVISVVEETAQSVILFDGEGRRQMNMDLKDVQETPYPQHRYAQTANGCDWVVLCNVNFSRPFLDQARKNGKHIATDVHQITDINDDYNHDFMRAANVLFMSHEWLAVAPEEMARQVWNRFDPEVLVIGMGAEGALLALKHENVMQRVPAAVTRPLVNVIGAGDALFSCFVHYYIKTGDPYQSLQKAMIFASYKIGAISAADGFLNENSLETLYSQKIYRGS